MAQQEPKPYTGPSVKEMIANHTLADNIIKYHNHPTSDAILDQDELATLLRFVNRPEDRDQILADADVGDSQDGKEFHGSLVNYVVLKHKEAPILTDDEVEKLKKWFDSGAADDVLSR